MAVRTKLKELTKAWKKAEAREGFSPVPDGTYEARIDSATIAEAKQSKRLQVGWAFTVVSGEHVNRKLFKYDGLEREESLDWLKGTLERLELEIPDDIMDLADVLEECEGLGVEITVRTKDEFQNIYINELIDLDDVEDYEESDEEDDEDDDSEADDAEEDEDDDEDEDEEDEDEDEEEEEEPPKTRKRRVGRPRKKK